MTNIEGIDNREIDEIGNELSDLKKEINENTEIQSMAERYGISEEIFREFYNILKDYFGGNNIDWNKNMDLELSKKLFGDVDDDLTFYQYLKPATALYFFYFKKKYPSIYKLSIQYYMELYIGFYDENGMFTNSTNRNINNEKEFNERFFRLIDRYGDNIVKYLQYCEPRKGTYIRNSVPIVQNFNENDIQRHNNELIAYESHAIRSMAMHFFDIFENEPEAGNLFNFLETHPQKLENLGGKEVKSIDLDVSKGINFCFRGIMEMVKSRPDIKFPHLNENPTETEKIKRENDWQKIIKEYEQMIRNYITRDFNPDGTEKGKPFDKVFFSAIDGDTPMNDPSMTSAPLDFASNTQLLTDNSVGIYSHKAKGQKNMEEDSEDIIKLKHQNMLPDIENYAKNHPNEKILVCIIQHGNPDGSSSNLWTKEDWIKLANISPNIKIWSVRCFFGTAFENESIYSHKSSVSGFSNESVTSGYITNAVNYAYSKGVGFHEMEILARMNYNYSVTSLTESMEYTNRNTGETEIGKIGLAQNDNQDGSSNINYA